MEIEQNDGIVEENSEFQGEHWNLKKCVFAQIRVPLLTPDPEDECFICDIVRSKLNHTMAASLSTNNINIYREDSFIFTGQLKGHKARIHDILFHDSNPEILVSASEDKTVTIWDCRSMKAEVTIKSKGGKECYSSCMNDTTLAIGAESSIQIWDTRTKKLLDSDDEAHQDDVTQVRFHPFNQKHLFSGSVDGLCFDFDINTPLEDGMQAVFPVEQPINKLGFWGQNGEILNCITTTEGLVVWDVLQEQRIVAIEDVRNVCKGCDYIIGCDNNEQGDRVVHLGAHNGTVWQARLEGTLLIPVAQFKGGHAATVRGVVIDNNNECVWTAGEDAKLCCWSKESPIVEINNAEENNPSKSVSTVKELQHKRKFGPY